jgi:FdhD protein
MMRESPAPPLAAGPTSTVEVRRWRSGAARLETDELAVEAPLEIRLGKNPITVVMRTPGDDEELVAGFLFDEGIIDRASDIRAITRPPLLSDAERGNVIAVELAHGARRAPSDRLFFSVSSCGVCGKRSLGELAMEAPVVDSPLSVARAVLATLPEALRAAQPVFEKTGGLHGAGLFTAQGELLCAREDIGRHNAVDKVVGWALRTGRLPLADAILVVSGRLGYEIAQKGIMAGLPIIASVGAASSLAVELGVRYGVTLATFVRPDRLNVFGPLGRIV